jgi:uncharacterized protein (TIGR04141 family)
MREEAQFSIYKISVDKIQDELDTKIEEIDKLLEELIVYVTNCIKKGNDKVYVAKYDIFSAIFIKSTREPIWKNMVKKIFDNNENNALDKDIIFNNSSSYILFAVIDKSLFAMTGGRAAHYLNKFIERNFGLYLIPKIFDKTDPMIKSVVENNLTGNSLSTQRVIKNITSIAAEENLGSVYKELSLQISCELATEFGINEEESKKYVGVSTGDSIVIRRSINLGQLKNVLNKLIEIYNRPSNFALNYFVPITKKGKTSSELNGIFYEMIFENNFQNFEIVPDDIQMFYTASHKYILKDDNSNVVIDQDNPIKLEDIMEIINNGRKSISSIKKVFREFKMHTIDQSGECLLYPTRLLDVINGFVEIDNETYYVISGAWYVFEEDYYGLLNNKYSELFDSFTDLSNEITSKYNLIKNQKNENEYNDSFKEQDNVIHAHTKLIKNVEIADLIFFDDDKLYLMCNKSKFDGPGIRDLSNQIITSAKLISNNLRNGMFIDEYYNKLSDTQKAKISSIDFFKLFSAKKIVYIAGFSNNFKKEINSIYCKYLTTELYKNLALNNFDLIILNYNSD